MKNVTFIVVTIFLTKSIFGQQTANLRLSLVKTLTTRAKDFTTDNLGNIYLLTSTNQVKKLDARGDSVAVYNDVKRYGSIYSIDATNPLKILVYYKDFSTIIILDRLLNVRNSIDLRKQDILQVRAITTSYDNNIWMFDEMDSKLKKIDDSGKVLFSSTDFRQIFASAPAPGSLYDRDGQLYLYDPAKGLFVFDYYGAKKNNLQLLHLSDLQVLDKNTITGRDSTHIFLYKPSSLQLLAYKAFDNQSVYKKINFKGDLLYCLNEDGELKIFSVLK
ncbi:MAG TPA: hypothetical protein VLJ41_13545 [Segetibacter sp.]|nr:hypothetical protein [Segetibacter sp.]